MPATRPETSATTHATPHPSTHPLHRSSIALTKTASPSTVQAGAEFTFTLELSNTGAGAAADLSLVDVMPTGVVALAVDSPACSLSASGDSVTCSWATLAAEGSETVTITATATEAGTYNNQATASATGVDDATATAAVVVEVGGRAGEGR